MTNRKIIAEAIALHSRLDGDTNVCARDDEDWPCVTMRLADALEGDGFPQVQIGVRVGTWPTPDLYYSMETAKHHAANPREGYEAFPHVIVTREVTNGPWVEATS